METRMEVDYVMFDEKDKFYRTNVSRFHRILVERETFSIN